MKDLTKNNEQIFSRLIIHKTYQLDINVMITHKKKKKLSQLKCFSLKHRINNVSLNIFFCIFKKIIIIFLK